MKSVKKSLLKLASVSLLCGAAASLSGCAEIMKAISGATSMALTQKTSSISLASVQASYVTNLYTKATHEVGADILGEMWKAGDNAIMVSFLKNKGIGFYEIEGELGWRNAGSKEALKPLTYIMNGTYVATFPGSDKNPKEVVITTKSGQTDRFILKPTSTIGIKLINGKASAASIDLNKDLTLDLEMPTTPTGQIRVSLLSTVMTNRTFVELGVFKAKSKLVIPAAAFKNPSVSASMEGVVGFDQGENYLRIEHFTSLGSETRSQQNTAAFLNLAQSWDTVPVTVTGDAKDISSLKAEGSFKVNDKEIRYNSFKSNAFYSPPLQVGTSFGLASLTLSGRLFEQKTTTSEKNSAFDNYRTITTTTITKAFPELPDSHWDLLLDTLAKDLESLLKRRNIGLKYPNLIKQASAYQELEEPPLQNNQYAIQRSYQGSKYLTPQSLGAIVNSASSTFAYDRPSARLMRQTDTNGLIAMHLDLQVATDNNNKIVLIPALRYKIDGPSNGFVVNTTYAQGAVYGTGVPFSSEELQSNPGSLARVVQEKELVQGLEKALGSIEQEAKTAGYQAIWALH